MCAWLYGIIGSVNKKQVWEKKRCIIVFGYFASTENDDMTS